MDVFIYLLGLGVSLSWLAFIPSKFPLTTSSGIYSIDGQTPIPFFVPALSASNSLPLFNQILFKTETLSPGKHELIAIYEGNSGAAPLTLDAFIVQNGTSSSSTSSSVPSSSTPSSSFPSSSSSNSTSNLGSKKSNLVGIVLGVAGGVIVLVLLLLLFHIRRRRNRRSQTVNELENSNIEPFTLLPNSPQSYISEGPSASLTLPLSRKFSRRREYANALPSGLSRPTSTPVIGAGTNPISPTIRDTPLMPSTSVQEGNLGFIRHSDGGVLTGMPHDEGNLAELPPLYTSLYRS